MIEQGWTEIVMGLGVLVLIAAVVIVVLVQGSAIARARLSAVAAQEYRALAQRHEELAQRYRHLAEAAGQERADLQENLAAVDARLSDIERLLRSVD